MQRINKTVGSVGTKKAAPVGEAARLVLLPRLDELRTYCYENEIVIPETLAAVS